MYCDLAGNHWRLFAQVEREYYFVAESSRSNAVGGKESLLMRQKMLIKFC